MGHNGGILTKRVGSLTAVLLLALGLGACGSTVSTTGFKGEAEAVAKRISSFQSDVTAANEQKVCNQDFAGAVRVRLNSGGGSCQAAVKRQLGSIDDYEMTVEKIAVKGTDATAVVKSTWSGKPALAMMRLVKEGGGWRIAALG
jgi:Putative lumazine-binding